MTQRLGLVLGPVVFVALLCLSPPEGLGAAGMRTAAIAGLMAVWWVTEAIPIPATALLPLALFPTLGVMQMSDAAAPYANDMVYLQMGGFLLAAAMQRCGLHKRVALGIVAAIGSSPRRIVLGFMVAAAFLSMWISNTATTAMMLPIAMAVGVLFRPGDRTGPYEFGVCLMLGIAYAATIGGVATLIGTPPNAVLAASASELLGIQIGFLEWMAVGLPITVVFLPLGWWLLTRWLFPPGEIEGDAGGILAGERAALGPVSRAEWVVGVVFALTALAWVLRAPKEFGDVTLPGIQTLLPMVKDSTIAVVAAVALFVVPVDWKRGEFSLDWEAAKQIPWGVLLLFGGGLSLARGMDESGLAGWIGGGVEGLGGLPGWLLLAVVAALFVLLTEITSNVATATMAMPVMAGAAVGLGIPELSLMAVAALSASMAFMLPVATPPNAIVFGSGYVTIPQMVRAGVVLNAVAVVLVTLAAVWLVPILVTG